MKSAYLEVKIPDEEISSFMRPFAGSTLVLSWDTIGGPYCYLQQEKPVKLADLPEIWKKVWFDPGKAGYLEFLQTTEKRTEEDDEVIFQTLLDNEPEEELVLTINPHPDDAMGIALFIRSLEAGKELPASAVDDLQPLYVAEMRETEALMSGNSTAGGLCKSVKEWQKITGRPLLDDMKTVLGQLGFPELKKLIY